MPLDRPLDTLTEADLQALITDGVSEGKTIDYKATLPTDTHDGKKEFLADLCSFANAVGGHLVFGITCRDGVPIAMPGLGNVNPDAAILRLENLARTAIEPRIPGLAFRALPLQQGGVAIIARIPHSWAQPHVVNFERHWRFYSRNSAGKYPLDIDEVRAAFALSGTIAERTRLFRADRLSKIIAGETPVPLEEGAKTVLHIVPFNAFDPRTTLDMAIFGDNVWRFLPIGMSAISGFRFNLDGLLTYTEIRDGFAKAYLQVFRNGCIEAAEADLLPRTDHPRIIHSEHYEEELLRAVPLYQSIQRQLGVELPCFLLLSLLDVRGCYLRPGFVNGSFWEDRAHPIDRDSLILPEVMIEAFDQDPAETMRPAFDMLWNAAGWPRSENYDETGRWRGAARLGRGGS